MKRLLSFVLCSVTFCGSLWAQDMTPVQILTVSEMPQAEKFLPDPPAQTDPLFFNDMVQYQCQNCGAVVVTNSNTSATRCSFCNAPVILGERLEGVMKPDYVIPFSVYTAARQSISSTKTYYSRMRPYQFFREPSSTPEKEEVNDFTSYPSGHTVRAWAVALALVSIDPEHQNEILKTGYEIGQSRVIVGFHYQSDVDAARLAGSAAFARLSTEPVFQDLFQKAKAEFDAKK